MNASKIMRVGRHKRFFEQMEPHLRKAEQRHVKLAIDLKATKDVQDSRRGFRRRVLGDSGMPRLAGPGIPNNLAFWKRCHYHRVFEKNCYHCRLRQFSSQFGLETMDRDERQAFLESYPKVFSKLSVGG